MHPNPGIPAGDMMKTQMKAGLAATMAATKNKFQVDPKPPAQEQITE